MAVNKLDINTKAGLSSNYLKNMILNGTMIEAVYAMHILRGYMVTPFHYGIIKELVGDNPRGLLLAPRGFGKTEIIASWIAVIAIRDRDCIILITSRTDNQIKGIASNVRGILDSDAITKLFGSLRGDKWNLNEFNLVGRSDNIKEPAISCYPAGNSVISKHYDLIIADDLVVVSDSRSPADRMALESWFKMALLPTLNSGGKLRVIGTPYHSADLYSVLLGQKNYKVTRRKSLVYGEGGQLVSTCPEMNTVKELIDKRDDELGLKAFQMQYQMDYSVDSSVYFNNSHFRFFDSYDIDKGVIYVNIPTAPTAEDINNNKLVKPVYERVRIRRTFFGIDLATGQAAHNDYFVVAVGGIDKYNNLYVLDIFRTKDITSNQEKYIELLAKEYNPHKIAIEANGPQKGFSTNMMALTKLPIVPIINIGSKEQRADIFIPRMEKGQVYFNSSMPSFTKRKVVSKYDMEDVLDEFLNFPRFTHDDMVDAVMMLSDIAIANRYKGSGMLVV